MDAPLINITPMFAMEARECINAIKNNLESLRLMLLELHRRRGWEALEYTSWEDCAKAEFGKSRAYTFRLLAAGCGADCIQRSLRSRFRQRLMPDVLENFLANGSSVSV